MNLLTTPVLTTADPAGHKSRRTLPGTLAALVRGEVSDFPRVRPHQRHPVHALLVQLAALALLSAGRDTPPEDEDVWRDLLKGLTPDEPDEAAWCLVSPPTRPAFLQPPVPGGDLSKFRTIDTPDDLDVLISAKYHDVKSRVLPAGDAELWLYALVSLQTQEGFLGAGNYGISRMNGGFASRPALGLVEDGGASAAFGRDLARALLLHDALARAHDMRSRGGLALIWLVPWDGATSLGLDALDIYYVEVCRRVRLVEMRGGLVARATSSKGPRIAAKEKKGDTGDLWAPLVIEKDGRKSFTADARGWSYQQLVRLLFPVASRKGETIQRAPLQEVADSDSPDNLTMLARVLVRGQGKTEGFHERRIPVSRFVKGWQLTGSGTATDPLAEIAHARVQDAGTFARKVLFPAVMQVFSGAPRTEGRGERARDDDTTKSRAGDVTSRFDTRLDAVFFDDLAEEAAVLDDPAAAAKVRALWIRERLLRIGQAVLSEAIAGAPDAAARHWRVRVQAHEMFKACFYRQFADRLKAANEPLPDFAPEDEPAFAEEDDV